MGQERKRKLRRKGGIPDEGPSSSPRAEEGPRNSPFTTGGPSNSIATTPMNMIIIPPQLQGSPGPVIRRLVLAMGDGATQSTITSTSPPKHKIGREEDDSKEEKELKSLCCLFCYHFVR